MKPQSKTETIKKLYQEGKSVSEIAKELNVTYQRVYNTLRRARLLESKGDKGDTQDYDKFISGLNIRTVQLREAHAKLERSPSGRLRVSMDQSTLEAFGPEKDNEGFWAGLTLNLSFHDEQGRFGFVHLKVAVLYTSSVFPDSSIFQIFSKRNLPVNIWPYLRLYVDFFTGQMGLPRLVLPAFKA